MAWWHRPVLNLPWETTQISGCSIQVLQNFILISYREYFFSAKKKEEEEFRAYQKLLQKKKGKY